MLSFLVQIASHQASLLLEYQCQYQTLVPQKKHCPLREASEQISALTFSVPSLYEELLLTNLQIAEYYSVVSKDCHTFHVYMSSSCTIQMQSVLGQSGGGEYNLQSVLDDL